MALPFCLPRPPGPTLVGSSSVSRSESEVGRVVCPGGAESVPAKFPATAIAVGTMTAELVGSTIGPALGGIIAGAYGLEPTLVMASLANVVVLVAVLGLVQKMYLELAQNGERWRSLGKFGESASYSDVDEATAKILDNFLEGGLP